jgi:polysaccharide biosynthesis/export protein
VSVPNIRISRFTLFTPKIMKQFIATALLLASAAAGQQPSDVPAATLPQTAPGVAQLATPASDYVLGPNDQFSVVVPNLETEFTDKTFRIDMSGDVTLPLAGRVHAAGLSTAGLEDEVRTRLARILKDPEVAISLSTFGSQPVSILGAVNSPGIRQIEGGKSLFEVLSLAGGLRPDAGYLIRITRDMQWGPIPLPTAQIDTTGRHSTVSIRVKNIMHATDTGENIPIMPGDTISVPQADVVYAVGSVTKPGGFPLNDHETLSALQVVSLAQGLLRTAASDKAKILRVVDGSPNRVEIPVNLKTLMAGKGADVQLRASDILFIPNSAAKTAGFRTIDAIVSASTYAAIYAK